MEPLAATLLGLVLFYDAWDPRHRQALCGLQQLALRPPHARAYTRLRLERAHAPAPLTLLHAHAARATRPPRALTDARPRARAFSLHALRAACSERARALPEKRFVRQSCQSGTLLHTAGLAAGHGGAGGPFFRDMFNKFCVPRVLIYVHNGFLTSSVRLPHSTIELWIIQHS